MRRILIWAPLLPMALLLLTACELPDSGGTEEAPVADAAREAPVVTIDAEGVALNNLGVAQMGRFDYAQAVETFEAVVADHPDWVDARLNLAIATLNRQGEGDEAAALAMADGVLERSPEDLRAHYIAGLLRYNQGDLATAREHFDAVVVGDPEDAYAAYFLAQSLMQLGEVDPALLQYARARRIDPYLRSAYYGAAQALRRADRSDEARALLADYQRFEGNPRARLAEFKYTRMGPKALALAVGLDAPPAPPARPQGPLFDPPVRLISFELPEVDPALMLADYSMTSVDLDADGRQDLAIGGPIGLTLLRQGSDGSWTPLRNRLAGWDGVNAIAWGDVDNDGRLDGYICREGANALVSRAGSGWEQQPVDAATLGDAGTCTGAQFADADHDGDLDLLVTDLYGSMELFNNDLDGGYRRLAGSQGLQGPGIDRQVLAVDLDADGDLDLMVFSDRSVRAYLNDRLWQYTPAQLPELLSSQVVRGAVAADFDADGRIELITVNAAGEVRYWPAPLSDGHNRYLAGDASWTSVAVMDADGDGTQEVLAAGARSWRLFDLGGHTLSEASFGDLRTMHAVTPVLLDPSRGPSVVALVEDAQGLELMAWPAGRGRYRYAVLQLSGHEAEADSMRSNRAAIGTRIAAREDSRWSIRDRMDDNSGPGQSLEPVVIGMRGAAQLDFVAFTWPDGVFQTEIGIAAGSTTTIEETQRQLSSCPVLYTWDGERFSFVSDLLGVGGVGFMIEPGVSAEPRPWERFLLPAAALAEREGRYEMRLGEPMQEVAYLDGASLSAVDLPPGWSLTLDERMGTGGPAPSGEAIYYRREAVPVRASNDRGEDVLAAISALDQRAAPVGELDRRFIGRLAGEHVLTLEFDQALAGSPVLLAEAWVEYPYSQTVFAAWQADASYDPVTLEYRGVDGEWHLYADRFGYPAGMPRQMTLPLNDLPAGVIALRLRTNLEVYWDRIEVVFAETPPTLTEHQLPLASARLAKAGFPRRDTAAQRLPSYDYEDRSPFWDTEYPAGYYTALGPVDPLVSSVDDAVVTIGPGEEAQLAFAAELPALAEGWSRRFVLTVNGWAKDMDLYTADGGTVGPFPTRGGTISAEAQALMDRYTVRYQAGR